jgi:hypothetical protein
MSQGDELPRPRPVFAHGATWSHDGLTLGWRVSSVAAKHEHRRRDTAHVRRHLQKRSPLLALSGYPLNRLNSLNPLNPLNRRGAAVIAAALFGYVLWMRTYDVATTFLMLGEQTRDWAIALGGITDLPLLGAPSPRADAAWSRVLLAAVDRPRRDRRRSWTTCRTPAA